MREIQITKQDGGQRFDKFLKKYLNEAPGSFIYKMLRKKNIKLNEKKAEGKEILQAGDRVVLYLSDETLNKFRKKEMAETAPDLSRRLSVVYEDENFLFVNKPAGLLSQKAKKDDISLVEHILSYLQKKGEWKTGDVFTPGICNRLDRNTGGIVLAGKNLPAVSCLSKLLKERTLHKYYLAVAEGQIEKEQHLSGWLAKNEKTNVAMISGNPKDGGARIETHIRPLCNNGEYTLLRVKLITGKTHQIRAHLAGTGHPLLGDVKYGGKKAKGWNSQLLFAWRVEFPEIPDYPEISGKRFQAPLPKRTYALLEELFGQDAVYQINGRK